MLFSLKLQKNERSTWQLSRLAKPSRTPHRTWRRGNQAVIGRQSFLRHGPGAGCRNKERSLHSAGADGAGSRVSPWRTDIGKSQRRATPESSLSFGGISPGPHLALNLLNLDITD